MLIDKDDNVGLVLLVVLLIFIACYSENINRFLILEVASFGLFRMEIIHINVRASRCDIFDMPSWKCLHITCFAMQYTCSDCLLLHLFYFLKVISEK